MLSFPKVFCLPVLALAITVLFSSCARDLLSVREDLIRRQESEGVHVPRGYCSHCVKLQAMRSTHVTPLSVSASSRMTQEEKLLAERKVQANQVCVRESERLGTKYLIVNVGKREQAAVTLVNAQSLRPISSRVDEVESSTRDLIAGAVVRLRGCVGVYVR